MIGAAVCAAVCLMTAPGVPAAAATSTQTATLAELTGYLARSRVPLPPVIDIAPGDGWEQSAPPTIGLPLEPGDYTGPEPDWRSFIDGPTEPFLRGLLFHELGHLVDDELLTDADRAAFKRIARIPRARPWDQRPNAAAERFAEAYRLCDLIGPTLPANEAGQWAEWAYAWAPTPAQQRAACRLIRSLRGRPPVAPSSS